MFGPDVVRVVEEPMAQTLPLRGPSTPPPGLRPLRLQQAPLGSGVIPEHSPKRAKSRPGRALRSLQCVRRACLGGASMLAAARLCSSS